MKKSDPDVQQKKATVKKILPLLKKMHPAARCELVYNNPLELLVATILSAQCTDVRVNQVTETLFKKYRTAKAYAQASQEKLEEDIRSTGFYRNKAKSIRQCALDIIERFDGKVPDNLDDLVTLPGIGRKTANVILGNAFGVPGITVDTHVLRLSQRLGLTDKKDAVKVEFGLNEIIPKKEWTNVSHLLIFHGRYICKARKPECEKCHLPRYCQYFQNILPVKG